MIIDRGSREQEAADELSAICRRLQDTGRYDTVQYCFLEVVPPYIDEGVKRMLASGIDALTIVPYFLYPGRKVKAAVTQIMKYQKETRVKFVVTKPMSMHKTLLDLVDSRIKSALSDNSMHASPGDVDVLVVGHGSKDPNAQISIQYITDGLARTYRNARHCFLEIEQPDIAAGIRRCKQDSPRVLVVVFYFLHEGAHVKRDIYEDLNPALEEAGLEKVCITRHLGADKRMIDLILDRAREVEDAD